MNTETKKIDNAEQLIYLMGRWNMTRQEALRVMREKNQDTTGL